MTRPCHICSWPALTRSSCHPASSLAASPSFTVCRYGTIPIVARTGGLADSVIDANTAATTAGVATGIVFDPVDVEGLGRAFKRAVELFADPPSWRDLICAAMKQPVGWSRSAARYVALYEEVAKTDREQSDSSGESGQRRVGLA